MARRFGVRSDAPRDLLRTLTGVLALLATVGAVAIICARTPPPPLEPRELVDDTGAVDDHPGDSR